MKKIIVLFVLALGIMSFSSSTTVEKQDSSISLDQIENEFSIETDVLSKKWECTATVYYNGVAVASFTVTAVDDGFIGMACELALWQAQQYIAEHS